MKRKLYNVCAVDNIFCFTFISSVPFLFIILMGGVDLNIDASELTLLTPVPVRPCNSPCEVPGFVLDLGSGFGLGSGLGLLGIISVSSTILYTLVTLVTLVTLGWFERFP
jgi:hypothetical protein